MPHLGNRTGRSPFLLLIYFILTVAAFAQPPTLPSQSAKEHQHILERARKGDIDYQLQLGINLQYGFGIPRDLAQAEFWIRRAADMGSPEAQLQLGLLYLQPEMGPDHGGDALRWFTRAAAGGLAFAEYNLALMHLRGLGIPANMLEAERWLRKAVHHRVERARATLGVMLLSSSDIDRQREGFELLRKSAKDGNNESRNALAYCYEFGIGTEPDMQKAVNLYLLAAKAGDSDSMHSLGVLYYSGKGVQKDFKEAFKWKKRGCDVGDAASCWSLGYLYLTGEGVQKDLVLAYAYISVANGNSDFLAKLAPLLTEDEKSKALAEAEKWEKLHAIQLSSLPLYSMRNPKPQATETTAGK